LRKQQPTSQKKRWNCGKNADFHEKNARNAEKSEEMRKKREKCGKNSAFFLFDDVFADFSAIFTLKQRFFRKRWATLNFFQAKKNI
jgi:hypothetical protein